MTFAKVNAWPNSQVRASLPDQLRAHMDGLGKQDLRAELRIMRNQSAQMYLVALVLLMGALTFLHTVLYGDSYTSTKSDDRTDMVVQHHVLDAERQHSGTDRKGDSRG